MAVIATLTKGYDLDYIWRQVDPDLTKDAAGYYIQASENGGEPPGRWWGPGAQALGLEPGQVVEREPYDLLFGERKAPDGTPLGRPPDSGRKAADIYAQLLAAEPHATAERKRELRLEATRQARQSPLYFDLTLSLSKSISIFHASLGENARLARQAGDEAGDRYWSGLVDEMDAMIWEAVRAGFAYFQREAGYTRTGSHNKRVNGRETGQWHEADLAVAHWLQHTSRDGDMQLHVHSQIAHIARTGTDGKWRAPDSLGYNEHIGAVGAIIAQHLEEALTRRFGVEWVARDDGHGFEITGHLRGDDAPVLLAPRVDHRRRARARGAVRAAVRPRAVAAGAGAARAGVELRHAQGEGRRAGCRAAARGLGGQARAHARRAAGVGRAVGVARRRRPCEHARARARFERVHAERARPEPRGAEGGSAGAAGEEHLDPRRPDQVPGPGAAPIRPGAGRGRRAAGRPRRPRAAVGVRAGRCAWKPPRPWRCRAACCAPTGAASTSGTGECGTPPARSWPWKNACSRKPAPRARRA